MLPLELIKKQYMFVIRKLLSRYKCSATDTSLLKHVLIEMRSLENRALLRAFR